MSDEERSSAEEVGTDDVQGRSSGTELEMSASGSPDAPTFEFAYQSGESVNDRVVRCCREALTDGPMGNTERHDFYREFISCGQETSPAAKERLAAVRTSCALFVRAVRHYCGAEATGSYQPGTPMFTSMGNVSYGHKAFVKHDGQNKPSPGDYFYISLHEEKNDGHTGIFLEEVGDNEWETAEGGGGDGTRCRLDRRKIVGSTFHNDGRILRGWFDCTQVGLPE